MSDLTVDELLRAVERAELWDTVGVLQQAAADATIAREGAA